MRISWNSPETGLGEEKAYIGTPPDTIMAPSPLQQRRTHNTLLFQKLLNLRDGASPLTLVLDSLEQSGRLVVREFWRRALVSLGGFVFSWGFLGGEGKGGKGRRGEERK